ncbi:MAG: hypothetical protein Q9221_001637 [Calogaya cf. arnoldii]
MSATTESNTPKLDAILAKMPKAALEISGPLRILEYLELKVVALRVMVKTLEAGRSLGDDASRRLEKKIRETSQAVQIFENSVEMFERIALEKATNLGLV